MECDKIDWNGDPKKDWFNNRCEKARRKRLHETSGREEDITEPVKNIKRAGMTMLEFEVKKRFLKEIL